MKTDKLFYSHFLSLPSLIHELIPSIPAKSEYIYNAPVIKETENRLDGVLTPKQKSLPLIILEAQKQKDSDIYGRLFAEIFLYLYQYKVKTSWLGLLIQRNRQDDLGSEIPYKSLLDNHITKVYLEELIHQEKLTANLALPKLIVAPKAEASNLAQKNLDNPDNEEEFKKQLNLIEAILNNKYSQLSDQEILAIKMPSEPRLYKQVVSFWKEQALQQGLQQGLQQREAEVLIRQLTRRFGSLKENQIKKARSAKQRLQRSAKQHLPKQRLQRSAKQRLRRTLSISQLETLAEAIFEIQKKTDVEK